MCSVIAITGLDGHAYGSWRGKGNLGRMWLRDFLSKDLPSCRTMIYGYNSKLSSHGINTIMDYGRELLEELKKIRNTEEVGVVILVHIFKGMCNKANSYIALAKETPAFLHCAQLRWHYTCSCRSTTEGLS